MIYHKSQVIPFEVITPPETENTAEIEFIEVQALDENDNPVTVQLQKLPFQKESDYKLPRFIECRVINIVDGIPVLKQHIPSIIFKFYSEAYRTGQSIECTVTYVPLDRSHDKFKVVDSHGLYFNVSDRNAFLHKGQKVTCKFSSLSQQGCILKFDNESLNLPFYSPEIIGELVELSPLLHRYVQWIWRNSPEFEFLRKDLDNHNPMWFINMMRETLRTFPWGFTADHITKRWSDLDKLMEALRKGALHFLEGSSFLNGLTPATRRSMQGQITELVESIKPFEKLLKHFKNNTQDEFVSSIFDKLEKSGYLYHPDQAFAVLMMIFQLYPNKVSEYLSSIFQSIFTRGIQNWEREPFRTAFVQQFEMYLRQAAESIDGLPMAETRSQKERLLTAITAIALKILLSKQGADLNRTYSTYYRYISLLNQNHLDELLNQSVQTLLGCKPLSEPIYSQLRNPMYVVATAAAIPTGLPLDRIRTNHRYQSGSAELTITPDGLELTHLGITRDTEQVVPAALMPWLHPWIYADGVHCIQGKKLNRLSEHNTFWSDLEHTLFQRQVTRMAVDRSTVRSRADLDDEVIVEIYGMKVDYDDNGRDTGNPRFYCKIIDENFEPGSGYMDCRDIVGYSVRYINDRCYRTKDGSPIQVVAKIIDIEEDGTLHFSLADAAMNYIRETFNVQTDYQAVITNSVLNGSARSYSGLTINGFGLYIEPNKEFNIQNSDIVLVRLYSLVGENIQGYIVRKLDKHDDGFTTADAFRNILGALSINNSEEEDEEIEDIYDELMPEDILELIEIIRYRALAEKNIINAFDYLRFARLLALLIDDKELASTLGTHAQLLLQHDFYASNKRIDPSSLSKLAEDSAKMPLLQNLYKRLEMVSWIDANEHNDDLYAVINDPEATELEHTIARMVLSYNMMQLASDNPSEISKTLKTEIGNALDVVSDTRLGKYYGSESKFIEFKTSLVYPAVSPGQKMHANPSEQQQHILSRIAGFLNAEGGTLFLGVNNQGYASGLAEDFEYYSTHPMSAGNHQHRITDADKLQVYIDNLLADNFGPAALSRITVSVDDDELNREKGRTVLRFDIQKSLEPIYFNSMLWVRQSGQSTRFYTGAAKEEFLRDRRQQLAELELQSREIEDAVNIMPEHSDIKEIEPRTPVEAADKKDSAGIATSKWRPNVLHNWNDGYAEPYGYLYFDRSGGVEFSNDDLYKEEESALALIIPHDMQNGFLILCYENSEPIRVPLQEIYEKGNNQTVKYSSRKPLRFAAVANDREGVLSIVADNSSNLAYRMEPVNELEQGHVNSDPTFVFSPSVNHVHAWEIVSHNCMRDFNGVLKSSFKRNAAGYALKTNEYKSDCKRKVADLIAKCHTKE